MSSYRVASCAALLFITACAQVPKESVELSATVGRDVTEIERSHLKLVDALFDRYEADANRLIDEVYTPFYVQKSLEKHGPRLVAAIEAARKPDAGGEAQQRALGLLQVFLKVAREEIENYRRDLLAPLRAQRRELRERLTAAYDRVHKANSIVTGHLASVVKVTDAQNDLLARLGLPDLQEKIGAQGEKLSNELGQLLTAGRDRSESAESVIGKFEELMNSWKSR